MKPKIGSQTSSKIGLHNLYLGADGGGTKTRVVLVDNRGAKVGEGTAGASNPLRVGIENAVKNISNAVDQACDQGNLSRSDIVSATLGLAGVRRADIRRTVADSFRRVIAVKKIEVVTDAEIALFGTTLGKSGLVVIAGTGSICYGQNAAGEKFTSGGWGPLAGDEGGGAGIARRALQAIAKASDGRAKPTELSRYASEYFRTAKSEDLIVAIYSPQTDNAKIAGFAKYVAEAARKGDKIAVEILREGGFELGLAAYAVIKKLKLQRSKFPIGCVGSVFKSGELITDAMLKTVHQIAPKAFLSEPKLDPADAAARMAFEQFFNGVKK